jgi:hypothetical protein
VHFGTQRRARQSTRSHHLPFFSRILRVIANLVDRSPYTKSVRDSAGLEEFGFDPALDVPGPDTALPAGSENGEYGLAAS